MLNQSLIPEVLDPDDFDVIRASSREHAEREFGADFTNPDEEAQHG